MVWGLGFFGKALSSNKWSFSIGEASLTILGTTFLFVCASFAIGAAPLPAVDGSVTGDRFAAVTEAYRAEYHFMHAACLLALGTIEEAKQAVSRGLSLAKRASSARANGWSPEAPGRFGLRLGVYPPSQVLQTDGRLCHLAPAFRVVKAVLHCVERKGLFVASRTC